MVSGTVTDRASPSGEPGSVRAVRYSTLPEAVPGSELLPAADGSFGFSFSTTGFPAGPIVVRVEAEDRNGNCGEASITLLDEGAVPSFRADPGNGRVTVSWEPAPLAGSYTLYYTTNGTIPSQNY